MASKFDIQKFIIKAGSSGLRPDTDLTVSEWADSNRMLSPITCPEPGPWRTDRFPFLREIMDTLSANSGFERVVFMKGSQIGGTECGLNWIGYIIDHVPGPSLLIMPTVDAIKDNSKLRIDNLISECPRLSDKVSEPRSRESGNTMLMKEFPGGFLAMTGANSPVSLRSKPIRFLMMDEVSAFPGDSGGEGDPVALAIVRTRNFRNRKIYMVSSPKTLGTCRITREWDRSDKRRYNVPCPQCGEYQVLEWSRFKWQKDKPKTVYYECAHCGEKIYEHDKKEMFERGKWIAEAPGGKCAGFHLPSFYAPIGFYAWAEMVEEFLEKKNDPLEFKTFVNTVFAEAWEERGDAPDWKRLYFRREQYERGTVPAGGIILVAGADVQKDRIEIEVVAYGRGRESWSVDYRIISGDTAGSGPWAELDAIMEESFRHESGNLLKIRMLSIDMGYNTQHVYNWVRKYPVNRVMATKGMDSQSSIIGTAKAADYTRDGKRYKRGVRFWPIGVGVIKSELYGYLRLDRGPDDLTFPPGYCHFPEYEEEYFKQLTAEYLFIRAKRFEWKKVRDRNEALDTRCYARAAAAAVGIDRLNEQQWNQLADELKVKNKVTTNNSTPASAPARRSKRRMISGGLSEFNN